MRKAFLIISCIIAITVVSCSKNDENVNFHFIPLQIVDAELPEAFDQSEIYEIKVTFIRPNSCTFFSGFDITEPDKLTRNIVVIGSEFEQSKCDQIMVEDEATFNFVCLYSDAYEFKFWTGEDANGEQQYLEIEVPVN